MKINFKALLQEQYLIPIKIIAMYLLWKIFHYFLSIPGTALNHFWLDLVFRIGSIYASATSFLLTIFGMKAAGEGININLLESGKQVWVQDHCLAIPAMVIFTGAVIFFKGKWKDKVIFLMKGLAGIILINLIRLILVCIAWVYLSAYFYKLNHAVLYVVVMYGFIFYMIASWMNKVIKELDTNPGSNTVS